MKNFINFLLFGAYLFGSMGLAQSLQEEVDIPFRYAKGMFLFEKNCSSCHGLDMTGTDKGPPLLHDFYKPSHHDDASFYRAGLQGVKAHHWQFGDMPAVEGMTARKMKSIVPYVRYYQQLQKLY